MKDSILETKALFSSTECSKVFGRLWNHVRTQYHDNPTGRTATNVNVKINARVAAVGWRRCSCFRTRTTTHFYRLSVIGIREARKGEDLVGCSQRNLATTREMSSVRGKVRKGLFRNGVPNSDSPNRTGVKRYMDDKRSVSCTICAFCFIQRE